MKTKNVYILPFERNRKIKQESDSRVHKGSLKYALDFPMKKGTKILAAESGTIISVKGDSRLGGLSKKYKNPKYMNKIEILHKNKEISGYYHLNYKGSFVNIGDKVKQGQVIGLSGNTGYSSEPHLHFMVVKRTKKTPGWTSLKIRFKKNKGCESSR